MPIPAKLSRRFYERLGDEIANELVEWFNAVDASYQSQLRELNELNCARFRAEMHQAFAEQETRLLKWMSGFWVATVAPIAGLAFSFHGGFR